MTRAGSARPPPQGASSSAASVPNEEPKMMTFGFLDEKEERPSASFAFASLFDRMRAAFSASPAAAPPAAAPPNEARHTPTLVSNASKPPPRAPRRPRAHEHGIVPLRTVSPAVTLMPEHATGLREDELRSPTCSNADADDSRRSEWTASGAIQSIPGFPLSTDVLEDARSVTTTRRARSDAGDDTMSTISMRPSADVWIRRFRGEGLSRKYWMADETAKECRDCLMPFTSLRRKHHCRICGQIFCSRCASNLVPGERWGHKGALRTCRQCKHMLEEYDHRQKIDADAKAASVRPHAYSVSSILEEDTNDVPAPLSEFAANTLFSHDSHMLPRRRSSASDEAEASTIQLQELEALGDVSMADPVSIDQAPFRSGLDEGDAQASELVAPDESSDAPLVPSSPQEEREEKAEDDASGGSGADDDEAKAPRNASPIRRSTARQKLMRGASRFVTSTALGATSLVYFLRMLHQLLLAEHVGEVQAWKETVKLLALAVIERIRVRTRHTYVTDIRNFVKIKCFPGGAISDCEFIDGYVCTKNVATKHMATLLPMRSARLLLIAFPIEYHRNANQHMSLDSIMAQEREFLRILVARILAQRPNVVFAEQSVSHLALELFEEAGVVVFCRMKRSSMDAIAHCTQADVILSIDRLALEPRLGRCASVSIDTYQHADAPELRKPLLRIEVASKEVGSALVLRGARLPKLRRIKAILALMVFVGYNLKLEEYARRDMGAVLDWSVINIHSHAEPASAPPTDEDEMHQRIILDETLKKYQRLLLSASISVLLPPPYLVTRMKQVTDRLHTLRRIEESPATYTYSAEHRVPGLSPRTLTLCTPASYRSMAECAQLEAEHEAIRTCWHACVSSMSKMLTPFAHQRLVTLSSTTCAATQQLCRGPSFQTFEFYGPDDEPLGHVLERVCAESALKCGARGCESANLVHYTTMVHNTMRIQMVVERFACPMPGDDDELLGWSYCKRCESTTPVTRISDEAWSLSFAKFLEIQCYPNASCHSSMCGHDYYRDNVRYFALHHLAIRFHADPIEPWDVVVPPTRPVMNAELLCEALNSETISLFEKNARYWRSVCERLAALQHELETHAIYTDASLARVRTQAEALLDKLAQTARSNCEEVERHIQETYQDPNRNILRVNEVHRLLQDKVVEWDSAFVDFEKRSTISERDFRRLTALHAKRSGRDSDDTASCDTEPLDTPNEKRVLELSSLLDLWSGDREKLREEPRRPEDAKRVSMIVDHGSTHPASTTPDVEPAAGAEAPEPSTDASSLDKAEARMQPSPDKNEARAVTNTGARLFMPHPVQGTLLRPAVPEAAQPASVLSRPPSSQRSPSPCAKVPHMLTRDVLLEAKAALRPLDMRPLSSPERRRTPGERDGLYSGGMRLTRPPNQALSPFSAPRSEPMALRPPWGEGRTKSKRRDGSMRGQVSMLAQQYDQMSRDAEQEKMVARVRRARPVTTAHATVEVFKNLRDAVRGDESDDEETRHLEQSSAARRGASWLGEAQSMRHSYLDVPRSGDGEAGETREPIERSLPTDASETASFSLSTNGGSELAQSVPSDLGRASQGTETEETHMALPEAKEGLSVPTRLFCELEATWKMHVGELLPLEYPFRSTDHVFSDARVVVREDEPSSIIAFTLDSCSYREQIGNLRRQRAGNGPPDYEQELRHSDGSHYLYEFDTDSVKLWCKIFFAEQFDALRHMCGCDTQFVLSLSRCVKWDSQGGKSGSAFLKTRDDRFVVKQLSRMELDGFSKFAPQYFAYLADCKAQARPTTLTKIFGYFRIGFKNTHTGKGVKMDFVAMENLLYGRAVDKIFDLKGSTRHRLVQETGRPHEVLLDENLLHYAQTSPLLVREHSKRILRAALYNDTLFLTEMNVMDYSLILALDATRGDMVMGIIDYLRTYTWDKRVESFVKETAILGGGGRGEPTIITPRQYRMRFLTFLDRNILMTPDPWMQPGWIQ
ncbi:1-phosphatidylinositol-3-phosphate 5-kinase [Malassezia nana]|uniref:1-phosphatidylinositol-3-phosphate 5-kinase n=1 Tax=Malassezia nana TaxID=180528 RepID=A0AAF0EM84_9BASI|nr:1-phosphatidylinositol-3-phosphate 5-kinase [Malassezia nana]